MSRYLNCSLLVGVALLTSACVVTQEEFRSLQQDVRGMRVELNAIAKKGGVSDGEEWGTSATDMVARHEELSVETRMIQGKLEENSHRLSELSQHHVEPRIKPAFRDLVSINDDVRDERCQFDGKLVTWITLGLSTLRDG